MVYSILPGMRGWMMPKNAQPEKILIDIGCPLKMFLHLTKTSVAVWQVFLGKTFHGKQQ
jgi:hypothetical protein